MSGRVQADLGACSRTGWSLRWTESGGPADPAAGLAGLRHQGDQRQHRAPARRARPVRLASRRVCTASSRFRAATRSSRWRATPAHRAPSARTSRRLPLQLETGNRVMLVEDEILVAMMMRDILTELGFSVVGPFSRLSEAMVAAVHDDIDAGILDVNLGGELVYPARRRAGRARSRSSSSPATAPRASTAGSRDVPIVKKPVQRQVLQKIFIPAAGERARFPNRRIGERARKPAPGGDDRAALKKGRAAQLIGTSNPPHWPTCSCSNPRDGRAGSRARSGSGTGIDVRVPGRRRRRRRHARRATESCPRS